MNKSHDTPLATRGDLLHAIARAGLGAIPVLGSAATELFTAIIAPPLETRRVEWMNDIADHLQQLEDRGELKLEELQQNEAFITTVMQASQAAIRNHQSEKRDALRNAVLNSALPHGPEESLQQLFINQIDTFTVWHIRLLDLFRDPRFWFKNKAVTPPTFNLSSSLEQLINCAWPESQNRSDFFDVIVGELKTKGLYTGGVLNTMMSANGAYEKRTTEMGDQFLAFIKTPTQNAA